MKMSLLAGRNVQSQYEQYSFSFAVYVTRKFNTTEVYKWLNIFTDWAISVGDITYKLHEVTYMHMSPWLGPAHTWA